LIGALAALAAYGVWPIRSLISHLPLVGLVDHSRLLFVTYLCVAMLASRGLDVPDDARVRWASVAAAAGLSLVLAYFWASGLCPGPTTLLGTPAVLTHPVVILALAGLLIAGTRRWPGLRVQSWLAAGLLLADFYGAHGPRPRTAPAAYPPDPPALELVRRSPDIGRTFIPEPLMPSNVGMVYRTSSIGAYEPTLSRRTVQLLRLAGLRSFLELRTVVPPQPDPARMRILDLLNVRHVLARPPLEDPELLRRLEQISEEPVAVYRNPHAFARVFIVSRAIVASNPKQAFALLGDSKIDLRQTVILKEPLPWTPPPLPDSRAQRAQILEYLPGDIRVDAEAPAGGFLVLSETFSPSWRVTVDGDAVRPLRGDYNLIAVPLRPGRHEVHFRYVPFSILAGGVVSATAILALLGGVIYPHRRASARRLRIRYCD
jgi:hypothetical protein